MVQLQRLELFIESLPCWGGVAFGLQYRQNKHHQRERQYYRIETEKKVRGFYEYDFKNIKKELSHSGLAFA